MFDAADCYRRYLAGDDTALQALVTAFRPGLRQYLFGIVHDFDLADDLTQETFVKLCLKQPKDHGAASFKTWLYTIGRNVALDELRRRKRRDVLPLDTEFLPMAYAAPPPEDAALRGERSRRLLMYIETLQPAHRQVLYLRYYEDFDVAQIAKIMKKSRHNTSALLYRAKQALKTVLEQEGFDNEI